MKAWIEHTEEKTRKNRQQTKGTKRKGKIKKQRTKLKAWISLDNRGKQGKKRELTGNNKY